MPQSTIWSGVPSVKGSDEFVRMTLLTFCLVGLQFTWGMEMTCANPVAQQVDCTPYLLELGLTKSKTSLVWIAGPLSGMIMAPAVGAVADRSKSRWGRRRPFMIGGTIIVGLGLFVLGWAKEIAKAMLGEEASNGTATLFLAIGSIYVVDFAINAVQWSCRSLIVDTLPLSKQQKGSAWASRMVAIGHLVGYGLGALDLEPYAGDMIGDTQFKRLIVIAALALMFTVGVTSWAVTERVLISDGTDGPPRISPIDISKHIARTAIHMPRRMKAVCWVHFWSWIGWFPFLFYSSEWIGEIYLKYELDPATPVRDPLATVGRIGSAALILFSTVTFIGSVGLPFVIQSPEESSRPFTPRPPPRLVPVIGRMKWSSKPTLLTAWLSGQFVFAGTMIMAPFVSSVWFASLLVALCGMPAAMSAWAPHAFMGIEISRLGQQSNSLIMDAEVAHDGRGEEGRSNDSVSGVYLGILNIFTTTPQFIGSFLSAVVFWLVEPGAGIGRGGRDGEGGYNGIGICLFIGALSALVAAYVARQLQKTG